jgi:hypothetical protein
LVSPLTFFNQIYHLTLQANLVGGGWPMPIILPDWLLGLNSIDFAQALLGQPWTIGIFYRVFFWTALCVIIFLSYRSLYKKDREIFLISFIYTVIISIFYLYFELKEFYSPGFTGEGYRAYNSHEFIVF